MAIAGAALPFVGAAVAWMLQRGEDNVIPAMGLGATLGGGVGVFLIKPFWDAKVKQILEPASAPRTDRGRATRLGRGR